MSTPSVKNPTAPRKPLAERLVAEGLEIVAENGPASLSLREVQRRAGVSPAAAYRHFRDRDALMLAIAQEAAGRLADHLAPALDARPESGGALAAARAQLVAGCRAYLDFAEANPGLYDAIFVSPEQVGELTEPTERAQGAVGEGGYNLLVDAVGRVAAATGADEPNPWDPVVVWSALHGLATLRLHAALRMLDDATYAAACERVIGSIVQAVPLEANRTSGGGSE